MPTSDEPPLSERSLPRVEASVAVELYWFLYGASKARRWREGQPEVPAAVLAEARNFWGSDDCSGELLIIADLAGCLVGVDIEPVLAAIAEPPPIPGDLPLISETPGDRRQLLDRLAVLAGDGEKRHRLAGILRRVWEHAEPDWRARGIDAVEAACAAVTARLEAGVRLDEVLPPRHMADPFGVQAAAAAAAGRLLLVPAWFGGKFTAWDLPNSYLMGFEAEPVEDLARIRRQAQQIAGRLRVLGDPTRVAILTRLAQRPAAVTEIARDFGLAQPTASAHLKLLREAGLVSSTREDGRSVQVVDRSALSGLIDTARSGLLGD